MRGRLGALGSCWRFLRSFFSSTATGAGVGTPTTLKGREDAAGWTLSMSSRLCGGRSPPSRRVGSPSSKFVWVR